MMKVGFRVSFWPLSFLESLWCFVGFRIAINMTKIDHADVLLAYFVQGTIRRAPMW